MTARPAPRSTTDVSGLRVLAFCDYFTPDSCGGSERVAAEVYSRLVAWGAEVTLVTARPDTGRSRGAPAVVVRDGIRVVEVDSIDLSSVLGAQVSVAPRLPRRVRAVADAYRPHVLHANGLYFQTSLAAARLARVSGLPLVTTAHVAGRGELRGPLRAVTRLYDATLGRFVLRSSDRAIAVSASVVRDLRELGLGPDRIDVVCNGVDHERFRPVARIRDGGGPLHVVFVGRLIANKGPQLVLDALSALGPDAPVRATFVGDGPLRARLQRSAQERGLPVGFLGAVRDVPAVLAGADVLVRPSFTEGLPLAVLEAMAAGVLVVASRIPGNADLVDHLRTGLLHAPADAPGLAACLQWAADNPSRRAELASAGQAASLGYSWEACARQTADVLLRVARSA